jgi:hypothetical protein
MSSLLGVKYVLNITKCIEKSAIREQMSAPIGIFKFQPDFQQLNSIIIDLALLLLHGREGLPQNRETAFKMAQQGSRSQGVLALCIFRDFSSSSPASSAANERARQLANASAEGSSGQQIRPIRPRMHFME